MSSSKQRSIVMEDSRQGCCRSLEGGIEGRWKKPDLAADVSSRTSALPSISYHLVSRILVFLFCFQVSPWTPQVACSGKASGFRLTVLLPEVPSGMSRATDSAEELLPTDLSTDRVKTNEPSLKHYTIVLFPSFTAFLVSSALP